ncbi:hypothetical protein GWK47_013844 [Chionoecetes opilio]|uniref:Uncharacterized protein n=1 Tax=Chionoecetes opilio TaxID=41210 RepID=A0A8J4XXJ8_CHIOP|nr:hypothetical protein GWK47_013844 [Chionoecetes opilio]
MSMSVDTLDTHSVRSADCVRSDLEAQDDLPSTQPLSQSTERESSQGQETGGEKLPANLSHLDINTDTQDTDDVHLKNQQFFHARAAKKKQEVLREAFKEKILQRDKSVRK